MARRDASLVSNGRALHPAIASPVRWCRSRGWLRRHRRLAFDRKLPPPEAIPAPPLARRRTGEPSSPAGRRRVPPL
jgi:hypothetical protein